MQPETRRYAYAIVLALLTTGSTFLFLGWPWARSSASTAYTGPRRTHGWYYRHYGGGHGGWIGRGFGWGTFGEFDNDNDGFRGGGPGFGK